MALNLNTNLDYDRPIQINEGVYWVGFYDEPSGLHCNPYIIVDGDEAVVIDGGSRPDFPTVMLKIMQAGVRPTSIKALVYQHYDPDLCGSIPNFESIIDRGDDLKIISDRENNMFIRHYSVTAPLLALESVNFEFVFSSGRKLRFTKVPYAHSPGNFVTFDEKSGVLFTSDLFGSYSNDWQLFLSFNKECRECTDYNSCHNGRKHCQVRDIVKFHQKIMPSTKALRYALNQLLDIPYDIIAPQHGGIITNIEDAKYIEGKLAIRNDIGIDGII